MIAGILCDGQTCRSGGNKQQDNAGTLWKVDDALFETLISPEVYFEQLLGQSTLPWKLDWRGFGQ